MSTLKIVICNSEQDADVARARMEDPTRGFHCEVVRQYHDIIWDATQVGAPSSLVFEDRFLVICTKP